MPHRSCNIPEDGQKESAPELHRLTARFCSLRSQETDMYLIS